MAGYRSVSLQRSLPVRTQDRGALPGYSASALQDRAMSHGRRRGQVSVWTPLSLSSHSHARRKSNGSSDQTARTRKSNGCSNRVLSFQDQYFIFNDSIYAQFSLNHIQRLIWELLFLFSELMIYCNQTLLCAVLKDAAAAHRKV